MNQSLGDEKIKKFEDNGFSHINHSLRGDYAKNYWYSWKILIKKDIKLTFLKNKPQKWNPFIGLTYLKKDDFLCPLVKEFMNKRLFLI